MEAKKTLIMRIYEVLNEYTDAERPMTQQEIIDKLRSRYGIECERKAVGRNISYLKEMGYDIESDSRGTYLATRVLEKSELRLLIDSVLCSRNVNSVHSKMLIDKLISLGGEGFKNTVKHVYSVKDWEKSENKDFFYNIEVVDDAIEQGKKIIFDYNKMGTDKKLHKTDEHTASPYQMLLHNQRYYLMLRDDKYQKIGYYRIDKMTNMRLSDEAAFPIKKNKGYEKGINYRNLATALPYMFGDLPTQITVRCPESMTDAIYDWFGSDFTVTSQNDGYITVRLMASEQAMLYWALQYNTQAEVISPSSLRVKVVETLKQTLAMYEIDKN